MVKIMFWMPPVKVGQASISGPKNCEMFVPVCFAKLFKPLAYKFSQRVD